MKEKTKKWIRPVLFVLGGAIVGLAYYYFVGCSTGGCAITSNPVNSVIYMGLIGWLLSGVFGRGVKVDAVCDHRAVLLFYILRWQAEKGRPLGVFSDGRFLITVNGRLITI